MAMAKKSPEVILTTPVWVGGVALRAIFLVILMVITIRVSSPQVEHLRSLLETPDELIRVALGFAVCVWLFINLFILPRDPGAYRIWLYLGLALVPLSVLCAVAIW
jgi:hypothetical protein